MTMALNTSLIQLECRMQKLCSSRYGWYQLVLKLILTAAVTTRLESTGALSKLDRITRGVKYLERCRVDKSPY